MSEQSTRTVERALSLLGIVCESGDTTLTSAARDVGLSPSTALRLLRTLENTGFVSRDDEGNYRAGSRLVQLGAQALSHESLIALCHDEMVELERLTGESVYLSVEGHRKTALYISIVEGSHSVRHANWVGRTIPLEGSASGEVLRGGTPATGYAVVERGVEEDVTAIAAPVLSGNATASRAVASLSLLVPSYRMTDELVGRYGEQLAKAAARLSSSLMGVPRTGEADTGKEAS